MPALTVSHSKNPYDEGLHQVPSVEKLNVADKNTGTATTRCRHQQILTSEAQPSIVIRRDGTTIHCKVLQGARNKETILWTLATNYANGSGTALQAGRSRV